MGEDIFAETLAVYDSADGAATYKSREVKIEAERAASAYRLLDGMDLAGLRVLDVGCGYGRDVAEFRRRGAEAYGCDASAVLIKDAVRNIGDYFVQHNVRGDEPLPFSGQFDVVWSYAMLVHIPRDELQAVLARMWDKVEAGGCLIVSTKRGDGEAVTRNLGEKYPRLMVFYQIEEILEFFKPMEMVAELADPDFSRRTPTDTLLAVKMRKAE